MSIASPHGATPIHLEGLEIPLIMHHHPHPNPPLEGDERMLEALIDPIPLLTSPLKGEEPHSLPFKGRVGVGVGMGFAMQDRVGGKQ